MILGSRRFRVAGSVFSIALGIGFVMQHGSAVASRVMGNQSEEKPAIAANAAVLPIPIRRPAKVLVQASAETEADPETLQLPSDPPAMTLADPERAVLPPDTGAETGLSEALAAQSSLSDFGLTCEIGLTATPSIAGLVSLSLNAPCQSGTVVTVTHQGLRFSEVTDATGALQIEVPALVQSATFAMRFDDGAAVQATAEVPEVAVYDRAILQWQGKSDLGLHAFEYGAAYGEPGHVYRAVPHAPARGPNRGAGFMTVLGSDQVPGGWTAEVYSFPAREALKSGRVAIAVEAAITAASCGRDVTAQTIQPTISGADAPVTLSIAMPDCSTIGDFLVLNNLVQEMKVAAR